MEIQSLQRRQRGYHAEPVAHFLSDRVSSQVDTCERRQTPQVSQMTRVLDAVIHETQILQIRKAERNVVDFGDGVGVAEKQSEVFENGIALDFSDVVKAQVQAVEIVERGTQVVDFSNFEVPQVQDEMFVWELVGFGLLNHFHSDSHCINFQLSSKGT